MSVMQQSIARWEAEKPTYTDQEVRDGLEAMIACAGSSTRANRLLKEHGLDIPISTLQQWKKTKREEYDQLREQLAPTLEREMVRTLRETALYAAEVERKAIEAAEKRLELGHDSNPAGTAANLSKVKATATDRLLALTGRPQQITEHRSYHEIVRSLAAKGVIELPSTEVQELPPITPGQDAA